MSQVMLIRHAQSANNAQPEHLRVCDPGITQLGHQQAQSTARALQSHPIRGLYCSPFLRSLQTTLAIAEATQVIPSIRADLFEEGGCYSGHLPGQEKGEPGMGRSELAQRFPGWIIDSRIAESGWWDRPLESTSEARQRAHFVQRWLENDLLALNHQKTLDVLVIHADFKRLLIMQLLGQAWKDQHHEQLGPLVNAGITVLEFSQGNWSLNCFNAASHLPVSLITD